MKIAFLGDSITCGYALADKSKKYSTLVSGTLGMEEENYGITGTLMAKAGLNRDNDNAFVTRISLIDGADVAVIFGGTNDYFWSDAPIKGEDDSYFSHALQTIAAHVKKHRAGKITLFVTPYPHNGIGNFYGAEHWKDSSRHDTDQKNRNGQILSDYVEALEDVCLQNELPILNLHKDFAFDWRVHTLDGCHPNAQGHKLLAKTIAAKLEELCALRNP